MADVRTIGPNSEGIGTRLLSLIMDDSQTGFTNHYSWGAQDGHASFADVTIPLAMGDNNIPVPSVAGGVLIIPPATNTTAINLVFPGPTLVSLNPSAPFLWCFATGAIPTSLVLYAGADISPVGLYFL